jgi:amidase
VAPIARTVGVVRLAFAIMVGEEAPTLARRRTRIGVIDPAGLHVHPACGDAVQRAAAALSQLGHELVKIPWESEAVAVGYGRVRRASMASFRADLDKFGPAIRGLVAEGRKLTALDYFSAYESASDLAFRVVNHQLLSSFDFLLTPTLGLPPMKIEDVPPFLSEPYRKYVQFVLPVSFAKVPAISIPAGLDDGLPVGVQLVGQFAREYELLDLAEELEAAPGFGYGRPPGID